MNQPKRRLGLSLTCVLIGCVVLAIVATALHRASLSGTASLFSTASQQISKATPRLVNASSGEALSPASHPTRQVNFSSLPVAFEPNLGQTDPQVKYLARGNGYTLFLTSSEAVLSLSDVSEAELTQPETPRLVAQMRPRAALLRMSMLDANSSLRLANSDVLPGVTNYFIGNDPSKWHAKIPTYARAAYRNVYPGIDLAFHGTLSEPAFQFAVAPQANLSRIRLHFADATNAETDASGNLVLSLPNGSSFVGTPVAYQEINHSRSPIEARFVVTKEKQVGLELGVYDRTRSVVIDYGFNYLKSPYTAVQPSLAKIPTTHQNLVLSKKSGGLLFYALLPIVGLAIAGVGFVPRRYKMLGCLLLFL